ncbi:hypothetical protein C6501_09935 [Candidatus Poribacteria bacterium]|nr:MAG: hypothetical protein C6501_09935 [Candidatus Poribacteria bacterium]
MKRMNNIFLVVFYVYIFIIVSTAYAQEAEFMDSSATIRGKIIDTSPEQKPIEGVTVTIVNTVTDATYTVTTDKDGTYEKTRLPAGRYTISVSKKGYGSRVSRSKVVSSGGEIFIPIKISKNETKITFFLNRIFTGQLLVGFLVGFAIGFFVASILNSRPSRV